MAIASNDAIEKFGTQQEVSDTGGTAAVANNAFSAAGDVLTGGWVNTDDAPAAAMVLECTFSVAPTAYSVVHVYARPMDIVSTADMQAPSANNPHVYLGSFPLMNNTSAQYIPIDVALPNVKSQQTYEFYLENKSGQSLPAGWQLWLTPKALGPAA